MSLEPSAASSSSTSRIPSPPLRRRGSMLLNEYKQWKEQVDTSLLEILKNSGEGIDVAWFQFAQWVSGIKWRQAWWQ